MKNSKFSRVLSVLLVLCVMMTMVVIPVAAGGGEDQEPIVQLPGLEINGEIAVNEDGTYTVPEGLELKQDGEVVLTVEEEFSCSFDAETGSLSLENDVKVTVVGFTVTVDKALSFAVEVTEAGGSVTVSGVKATMAKGEEEVTIEMTDLACAVNVEANEVTLTSDLEVTISSADEETVLFMPEGTVVNNNDSTITAPKGKDVTMTVNGETSVMIKGGYTMSSEDGEVVWNNPFTDVLTGTWFYGAVEYAYINNLFSGTTTTTFSPDEPMSRAMLVAVLHRLDGRPDATGTESFDDVAADAYYATAVAWAEENGIVYGIGDNKFDPNADVTREQVAAILNRYMDYAEIEVVLPDNVVEFSDEDDISEYAKANIQVLNKLGIISGMKNDEEGRAIINPKGNATRAEVASMLQRFVLNVIEAETEGTETEGTETEGTETEGTETEGTETEGTETEGTETEGTETEGTETEGTETEDTETEA